MNKKRVAFSFFVGDDLPGVPPLCAIIARFRDAEVLVATRSRSRFDSPPDCHSFRSRRFATSSPTTDFKIHRRGDSRIARSLFAVCVCFSRGVEDVAPLTVTTKQKPACHSERKVELFLQKCCIFLTSVKFYVTIICCI